MKPRSAQGERGGVCERTPVQESGRAAGVLPGVRSGVSHPVGRSSRWLGGQGRLQAPDGNIRRCRRRSAHRLMLRRRGRCLSRATCSDGAGGMAVCRSRFGLHEVAGRSGQNARRHIRVAFTGKTAGAHPPSPVAFGVTCPEEPGDVGREHRNRAQHRAQPKLDRRRDITPVCARLCSCHGHEYGGAGGGRG